jgi:hypothetical protein
VRPVPPDFNRTGGSLVAIDRQTAVVVDRVKTDTTGYGSVEAFGSWWVSTIGGVARYEVPDLRRR